jgi:hypothetical protein
MAELRALNRAETGLLVGARERHDGDEVGIGSPPWVVRRHRPLDGGADQGAGRDVRGEVRLVVDAGEADQGRGAIGYPP